ncbi:MAG: hypothetical protein M3328_02705 [Chloroflexota bacterium]|nr:hypothetical protein [Chloroflexota bacterium]
MFAAMLLTIGFLATWGVYRGGFPFFWVFLIILFVCMASRGRRGGWHHRGYGPQHNPWQGPEQQRPTPPQDARPYQGQPGAPGSPYQGGYGSYGNEGTPTVRTDMNTGAGTVRVDSPTNSGQPTAPLGEQPRARVENEQI